MDIPASLAALGSALTIVKELRAIDGQLDKAALRLKIADLTEALADAKIGVMDAGDSLRAKDDELAALREILRYRAEDTVREGGFTYEFSAEKKRAVGLPFCSVCEQEGKLHRLVSTLKPGRPCVCPKCKADFGYVKEYLW